MISGVDWQDSTFEGWLQFQPLGSLGRVGYKELHWGDQETVQIGDWVSMALDLVEAVI